MYEDPATKKFILIGERDKDSNGINPKLSNVIT